MSMKKGNQSKVSYWNSHLKGLVRVFAQEVEYKKNGKKASFLKFSTSLGNKDEDKNWENLYINIRFPKGDTPECDGGMNFLVEIVDGFLTFESYTDKSGINHQTPVLVITEWCDADNE